MQGRACYSSAQTIPRARPSKWTRPPQSDRADILITRTVAMGDAAEALLVAAAVRDITVALSLPRGGVKIPRPLVEPLAEYVVTTLKLESVDKFISLGPESAVSCVSITVLLIYCSTVRMIYCCTILQFYCSTDLLFYCFTGWSFRNRVRGLGRSDF